ncbi:hypothetical protein GCM10011394_10220 [Luteimonas terricola]|uniref:Uncharacterized protein n=1 Tax=Luteimonas terricola TaxID=645597 RepID=A0ABQ2EA51_9GAMM|nr:hypothetical protein GCM10011394_10220 [Luteimonas terricola]
MAAKAPDETQRRSDSGVQPTLPAIEAIAAHCDPCSPWCSSTIRTAHSRSSGEYRVAVFFIAPSSQRLEPPEKPGRFTKEALYVIGNRSLWAGSGHFATLDQMI